MAQGGREVFIEEIAQKFANAVIGPAAMHEKQALQEAKLPNGEIAGQHGLLALLPADTDADVRRFDHGDVIGTIAYCERYGFLMGLHQVYNGFFLAWRHSAADNRLAHARQLEEFFLVGGRERVHQAVAVDNERVAVKRLRYGQHPCGFVERLFEGHVVAVELVFGRLEFALALFDQAADGFELLHHFFVRFARDCVQIHVVGEQLAGEADVDGRFLLVASQHPDFDVRFRELRYALWYAVL